LVSDNIFIVQPDFIDDQFEATISLIKNVATIGKNVILWIIGRNLIVEKIKNSNKLFVYKKNIPDFILWNNNKEIMLKKATEAFVDIKVNNFHQYCFSNKRVFINIYSSNILKNLNGFIVKSIVDSVKNATILIDNANVKSKDFWCNQFQDSNISFVYSFSLFETYQEVVKSDLIFTSDSAIAHIANRLGKMCIVFYNIDRWDNENFLSIIHNSFIGFASQKPNFIPLILCFSIFSETHKLSKVIKVIETIMFLKNVSDSILQSANKYVDCVRQFDYKCFYNNRTSFINQLYLVHFDINLINEFYFCFFPEHLIDIIEKDIKNIRYLVEILNPYYKFALILTGNITTVRL
jgi:hypothetical protein